MVSRPTSNVSLRLGLTQPPQVPKQRALLLPLPAPQAFMDQWRAYMQQAGKRTLGSTTKADQVGVALVHRGWGCAIPSSHGQQASWCAALACAAQLLRTRQLGALEGSRPKAAHPPAPPAPLQIVRPPSLAEAMLGVLCECHRPASASAGGDSEVEEDGGCSEYMLAYPPPAVLNRRGRCGVEGLGDRAVHAGVVRALLFALSAPQT